MINVESMPCIDCVYFGGVKQPDNTESDEYISCSLAKNGNSLEKLSFSDRKVSCKYKKGVDTDGKKE